MSSLSSNPTALNRMAAAAAAALAVMAISLPMIAFGVDARERRREQQAVAAEYAQVTDDLRARVAGLANWDDALLHLDNSYDPAWALSNLTSPFSNDVHNRITLVVDARDNLLFAAEHAHPVVPARLRAALDASRGIIARIRATPSFTPRLPTAAGPADQSPLAGWITATGSVLLQGRPSLLIASLVGPDMGHVRLRHAKAPILLTFADVQNEVLPGLSRRLLLRDTGLVPPLGSTSSRAHIGLRAPDGAHLADIVWLPERPGTATLLHAASVLLVSITLLLAAIVLAYRQAVAGADALRQSEARAHHLAFHDGLTGLPNRRLFNDRAQLLFAHTARTGESLAVLLIDLDHFKAINDTYGHQSGDDLIEEVGRRLRHVCRAADTCARLGGDEFAILAPHISATEAAGLARRLLDALAAPATLSEATIQPSVSIGIAIGAGGDHTQTDLLRQADLALYKAKADGRDGFRFFEPEMDRALQDRRLLEADLRDALAGGALHLVYQPQFSHDRLIGAEALARWQHPTRGLIPPSLFVPLAEDTGLIAPLGDFVLRRAARDSLLWPGITVSVNVSVAQLRRPSFARELETLIVETGMDPARIELEITESLLLTDDPPVQEALEAIRSLGFRLALDDFGTGFCSLGYLGRFAIDRIKIDRSFIAGLPGNPASEAIVRAIAALAHALGIEVLAEGVETLAQKRHLALLGCRIVQGFLSGPPGDAATLSALLEPA